MNPRNFTRASAMLIVLTMFLLILASAPFTITLTSAEVTELNVPPEVVQGETLSISGKASPNEVVGIGSSFEISLPVSDGKYCREFNGIYFPEGEKVFSVTAENVKEVNVYDFPSLGIGVAIPYGAYDIKRGEGFVNVGISRDTSEFAVESIRQWWKVSGKKHYPNARELLICADGGGSNGSRRRGWKFFLQELTDQIGIPISLCHFPPGTCKWNKIEHCMFSFISMNWKGEPLVTYETIIKLISATTTKKGLKVVARLDKREYEGGVKFSDEDIYGKTKHKNSHAAS